MCRVEDNIITSKKMWRQSKNDVVRKSRESRIERKLGKNVRMEGRKGGK